MSDSLAKKFKKSLRGDRWNKMDLGSANKYTNDNIVNRWVTEKDKWTYVSDIWMTC